MRGWETAHTQSSQMRGSTYSQLDALHGWASLLSGVGSGLSADGFERLGVGDEWNGKLRGKGHRAAGVVGMLVGEQDRLDG